MGNKVRKHKAGILMPISSLPNKYGIGSFGKEAFDFVDFLKDSKQSYWQILPLGQTSYGDSPYQSPSINAGNPYFVDLDILYEEGLLTRKELKEAIHKTKKVDYGWLFENRYLTLRKAFSRFTKNNEYKRFIKKNPWVNDYALFMSLKVKNNYVSWNLWSKNEQDYKRIKKEENEYQEEVDFWSFIQFEFFRQWNNLKKYANKNHIEIIGDMPIYVAYDSVDVWKDKKNYLLDKNYNPTVVAGCPPDGFSPDGQLWGNPIYNYKRMQKDNFSWWVDRMKFNLTIYDIVRIDHFRGFAGYYTVPFKDKTARNGKWKKGMGKEIFTAINNAIPNARVIAEDLGFIDQPVVDLIKYCGYPRMKMLQFAFYDDGAEFLPRMYENDNCIVYSATHDSDCSKTWLKEQDNKTVKSFRRETSSFKGDSGVVKLIKLAMTSIANYAIIPLQDYLELTNEEGRMNTPSTSVGNWQWRVNSRAINKHLSKKIKNITEACKRD